jgi:hypothetical protein
MALAAGQVTEREKFQYLLVWAVIGIALPAQLGGWTGWSRGRVAFLLVSLLITIVGLVACFRANTHGDNRAFLERYLCLSVPLGLVAYALYYAIYYGIGLIGFMTGWVEPDARNWDVYAVSLVSSTTALTVYYLWMRASIRTAAGARAA